MPAPTIAISRAIFDDQLAALKSDFAVKDNQIDTPLGAALASHAGKAQGLLATASDPINAALLAACPSLKIISNIAVGYNNIDVAAATERGIMITNTPGVLTETTADMAWALLMATARHVPQSERWLRDGKWDKWALQQWLGKDVHGATLGIVGMGRIGAAVGRRAAGFGMHIVYHNRTESLEAKVLNARWLSLDDLLKTADFVVLVLPYSKDTHHIIGARELALMKPDAMLINIARGGIVDDAALVEALQNKRIGGAGLDVFEAEPALDKRFLSLDNAVLTPHIGSASLNTRRAMAALAIKNLRAGLAGEIPPNLVNPQVLNK
ncbi:MAG: 2-hydroxyacid dehydrogenase [Burkholderiaceae bacterium]